MVEGLAQIYLEKLNNGTNAGLILAHFFSEMYDTPFEVQNVIMFNTLVKVYGKMVVFQSILSLDNAKDYNNIHGLLIFYCKKKLVEQSPEPPEYLQTDEISKRIRIAQKTKLDIRSPFDA